MRNPYAVVKDFEDNVAAYTGAPYCVAVNSCTSALLLAVAWHVQKMRGPAHCATSPGPDINIPKRTYLSVPMSIMHAGATPTFRDDDWIGAYQLKPLPIWDSARWFTKDLWHRVATINAKAVTGGKTIGLIGGMVCTSHHWSKTLGIQQGGCILHNSTEADEWLRRARFDGRTEGIAPKNDVISIVGWHCYMSPEVAAEGLVRLHFLPKHNDPLPNDDYPDLSKMEIFQ